MTYELTLNKFPSVMCAKGKYVILPIPTEKGDFIEIKLVRGDFKEGRRNRFTYWQKIYWRKNFKGRWRRLK